MAQDFYSLLGVSRDAGPDEIKAAFRRLARKYHPDVNKDDPHAEEKFKEIGQAYAILSDDAKRREYDMYGTVSDMPTGMGDFGGISEIFEMFFGAGSARRTGPRVIHGRDLQVDVTVSLRDVVSGVQRALEFERLETCTVCSGSGSKPGSSPKTCHDCGGAGVIVQVTNTFMGQVRRSATCPRCNGEGQVITERCPKCKGEKLQRVNAKLDVNIPPGVDTGTVLHMPGQGDDGINGGRPGDLYIAVRVQNDARFIRDSRGLMTNVSITFPQAAIGARLSLEGVDSEFELNIPAGTQPGQEFRVRGQGVPPVGGKERGDLRVRVNVEVPKDLSEYQKQLLESFEKTLSGESPQKPDKGYLGEFLKTVKKD